jgi:hypothetical protein
MIPQKRGTGRDSDDRVNLVRMDFPSWSVTVIPCNRIAQAWSTRQLSLLAYAARLQGFLCGNGPRRQSTHIGTGL